MATSIDQLVTSIEQAAEKNQTTVSPYIQREAGPILSGPDAGQLTSRLSQRALDWLEARGLYTP